MVNILGKRLRECREEKGLTQRQVARYCAISERTYQGYERMMRKPRFRNLVKMADVFDVSLDYLVGRKDTKEIHRG